MNGILLINKPENMTSFDVVAIARKALAIKKIGHTGTLDPNATGVLVLLINKATKILPYIDKVDKTYLVRLKLGYCTDTYDIWGETLQNKATTQHTDEEIITVLNSFLGVSKQKPPIYSALKVKGKKLYEYARANQTVEIKERDITIYNIEFLVYQNDEIEFRVKCSSGTYIRSLCVDIASKLSELACMSSLSREQVGNYTLEDCYSINDLKAANFELISIETALENYQIIEVTDPVNIYHGKPLSINTNNDIVMIKNCGKIIACYQRKDGNTFTSKRGFW
ncbi:MAG: tRNA pseudouridine(55) synthase TruB [Erysipelotrichaceae bacterium]